MRRAGLFRAFLLAALAAVAPAFAHALEEQSLLTPDGTLHVVRSGKALDLGIQDAGIDPASLVVDWASRAQDGTVATQIVPGTVSYQEKHGLQLEYDNQTGTLLLLWTENVSAFSHIRIGVFHDGVWTNSPLLPSDGISRARNPQMRVSHQRVRYVDETDATIWKMSSILSVIWWEESQYTQARLATLFLDEGNFDPTSFAIYDLPALLGGGGDTAAGDIPSGSYLFPALQTDGLSGSFVASFADLHDQRHKVIRIQFPEDQGKPSESGNMNWSRRHIPIVGVSTEGPISRMTPVVASYAGAPQITVGTSIGSGYRPTLYWLDGTSLKFSRFGDTDWEPVRSIAVDESMTYEKALGLVMGMGSRK
jgi:hypothetical protein